MKRSIFSKALAALGASVLAAGALFTGSAAAQANDELIPVEGATMNWGVKGSFRNYLNGPIPSNPKAPEGHKKGRALPLDENTVVPANWADKAAGYFTFNNGKGKLNADASKGELMFPGGVQFLGHYDHGCGPKDCLNTVLKNVTVELTSATTGKLYLDFSSVTMNDVSGPPKTGEKLHFLDITFGAPTKSDGRYNWQNVKATATEHTDSVFGSGTYTPGLEMEGIFNFSAPDPAVAKQQIEEMKKAEEAKRKAEEAKRAEEAAKAEAERKAAEDAAADQQAAEAEAAAKLAAEEAKRKAEEAKRAEESAKLEAEKQDAQKARQEAEAAKLEAEKKAAAEAAAKLAAEEAKRKAEEAKRAEETAKAEADKKAADEAEAKRKADEAAKKKAESEKNTNLPATGSGSTDAAKPETEKGAPLANTAGEKPQTQAPAPAPAPEKKKDANKVTGTFAWGLRDSFRNYIKGGIAKGDWSLQGIGYNGNAFTWSNGDGILKQDLTGEVAFRGGVHFTGHKGILDFRMANPRVVMTSANGGTLYVDARSNNMEGQVAIDRANVPFATFVGTPVVSGNTVTLHGTSVQLTAEGVDAFAGFYKVGEPLADFTLNLAIGEAVNYEEYTTTGGGAGGLARTGSEQGVVFGGVAVLFAAAALSFTVARRRVRK